MYNLYVEKYTSENKQPVKLKYNYHVFSTKFNLHFKVPSKNTYTFCDGMLKKIKIEQDQQKKKELQVKKNYICVELNVLGTYLRKTETLSRMKSMYVAYL